MWKMKRIFDISIIIGLLLRYSNTDCSYTIHAEVLERLQKVLYLESHAQTMIPLEELFILFGCGAAIIIALCVYNKFGKVKQ